MRFLRVIFASVIIFTLVPNVPTQSMKSELDIAALIRECERNLDLFEDIFNYSFTQKRTIRSFNKRGEMTKEEVEVSEAFPTRNRRKLILVQISENGRPLSPQKIADERERAAKRIEAAERRKKIEQPKDPDKSGYYRLGFKDFLRAGEFGSPRRQRFGDRDALVLDFRPRSDFRPATRSEFIILNLVGNVWIDTEKKEIMRVEAYPRGDGYKTSSMPLGIIQPNAAFVFERKPTHEGIWIVSLMHFDTVSHSDLFNRTPINMTFEFSDYRRYETSVENYELNKPNPKP